jgi:hypothetical protein
VIAKPNRTHIKRLLSTKEKVSVNTDIPRKKTKKEDKDDVFQTAFFLFLVPLKWI